MKHHLSATVLLAAAITVVSVMFFSSGRSRNLNDKSAPVLAKAGGTRQPRMTRGSKHDQAPDYAGALSKSLRLANKSFNEISFDQPVQEQPAQVSKITPDVAQITAVSQDLDLRDLPYIAPNEENEDHRLSRHPFPLGQASTKSDPMFVDRAPSVTPNMPSPTQTFAGMTQNLGCGGCLPPDTDGDVGPNNYVQSVNSAIRVHDKSGNVLAGPITYNSFFSAMGNSTPCGANNNNGDGVVFYDHIADRWIISDFAYPAFPGTAFYQCIGVSKTSNPVTGGYWLYAIQVDPANPSFLGDYPKFGLWPDAYYLSVNMFSNNTTFNGVRVYALDRAAMINGGAANTIAFSILPADLGDQYSLLPATFRFGSPPPVAQPEWFMDINSSATAGTIETQVFVRRFHADFVTPANSTFGVGATHLPDGVITVNGFVDAFDGTNGTNIVPQPVTAVLLDTLGDKLMYPLVYQNLGGVESIYSSHTVNNNQGGTGPTGIRWYQFNVTANTIPAVPTQQQTFNNASDGLWRWMPSINVDNQGNMSIGYTTSSGSLEPSIRYAGRLLLDPPSTLGQGEAVMTAGTGHQTSASGRWGDYSSMFVDPSDGCTFYHTNEYFSGTSGSNWNTRVGSFKFPTCVAAPLATPTPTPAPTATPTPIPAPPSAGPVTVTATAGTVGPTDYATLQLAFAAINGGTHQGAINVYILGNTTETVSAALNASGTGAASYTSVYVQPSGGARTVSGAIAAGSPLIDLAGADNVTINGFNTGGNSLTIANTTASATVGTSTIRFINGAQNNTITNCTIQGSSLVTVGANAGGTILFSTSPAVGTTIVGNNSNIISANNIGPAGANLPIKAITGVGTTTSNNTVNRDNLIDNNNIFDFFGVGGVSVTGIDIRTGNLNWTVSNNRIYQTATRTFTVAALRYAGITLVGTTGASGNSHTITGNVIGFGAANGTGTTTINGSSNEFRGLDLAAASNGTATSVQGNVVSGINQTTSRASTTTGSSPFIAIVLGTTSGVFDVGNLSGNTIGSLDGSSTIVINESSTTASNAPVIGIYDFSLSSNNISNNNIGAITVQGTGTTVGFMGILVNTSSAAIETMSNNTIGGVGVAGAIADTQVGNYVMYGIQIALPAVSLTGNTVRNLNGNSSLAATIISSGVVMSSTTTPNASTISRNVIHSLSNNSGAGSNSIYALYCNFGAVAGNVVERNFVHSLSMTSSVFTGQLVGILPAAGNGNYQNNMVRLGIDAAGAPITGGFQIYGMFEIAGTNNLYYNSVYVGGTGVASVSNTFGFVSNVVTNTRNYIDNIFWNARSNASGTGKNYAIAVGGTGVNPTGLTSNFNDLYVSGTGGFVGQYGGVDQPTIVDWRTATGQDANSINGDPQFVNPIGTAATVNLHITTTSPARLAGTPIASVTNDFDNDPRPAIKPDIGADQVIAPTAGAAIVSGQITTANGQGVGGVTVIMSGGRSARAITDSNGNYRFFNVETDNFYSLRPSLANYQFSPAERAFSLLGNKTDAVFTAILDASSGGNAIDSADYFVRQHYLDFLGREPDESGFNFWSDQISSCGNDAACVDTKRVNVSAAYFLSIEFQETGGLVDGLYRASYGRRPQYGEFMPDSSTIAQNVIVGRGSWTQDLQRNREAFVASWVNRPEFRNTYDSLGNSGYVDTLLTNTRIIWTQTERNELVSGLVNHSLSRADVLLRIAQNDRFAAAKHNEMFVMMEYFGYLRRDPDEDGYQFWLNKLNQFDGNFEQAEMVKAFIVSGEYRQRFGR
jgi:hypothetical protein